MDCPAEVLASMRDEKHRRKDGAGIISRERGKKNAPVFEIFEGGYCTSMHTIASDVEYEARYRESLWMTSESKDHTYVYSKLATTHRIHIRTDVRHPSRHLVRGKIPNQCRLGPLTCPFKLEDDVALAN
jgi:hypothetical protein